MSLLFTEYDHEEQQIVIVVITGSLKETHKGSLNVKHRLTN